MVYVFLGVVTVQLVIARSNPKVQVTNLNPPMGSRECNDCGLLNADWETSAVGSSVTAGSSLQLEPEGLCISGRRDCSIGYRLLKPQGSDCKSEPATAPARLVGAVSDGDWGCGHRTCTRSPTGVGSYQKRWCI